MGLLGCNGSSNTQQGDFISNNGTNICATAGNPYIVIPNCTNGPQAEFAGDVWYSFVATGTILQAQVSSAGASLNNPNISLYEYNGSCDDMLGYSCVVGANGTATLIQDVMTIGETYYLQISGSDIDDQCDFTLTIRNNYDCSQCLLESEISFISPEPVNGTFNCGETVQMLSLIHI